MHGELVELADSGQWWVTPDWWVAIGTLGLALVTFWLAVVTRRAATLDKEAREVEAADRRSADEDRRLEAASRAEAQVRAGELQKEMTESLRRGQAERVYALPHMSGYDATAIKITNGSDAPVYDVVCRIWIGDATKDTGSRWRPTSTLVSRLQVLPRSEDSVGFAHEGRQVAVDPTTQVAAVALRFRDAGDRHWARTHAGHLVGPFSSETSLLAFLPDGEI